MTSVFEFAEWFVLEAYLKGVPAEVCDTLLFQLRITLLPPFWPDQKHVVNVCLA
jgi:hypothetical protein